MNRQIGSLARKEYCVTESGGEYANKRDVRLAMAPASPKQKPPEQTWVALSMDGGIKEEEY